MRFTIRSLTNVPISSTIPVAVVGLAPVFGWALASERWFLVGALALGATAPLVIRWPVISTFGLYALLVPFDLVPYLQGNATLTKPLGVLAAAVLLAVGLIERRLERPPVAAIWWGLLIVWAALSATWALDSDLVLHRLLTVISLYGLYLVASSFRVSTRELLGVCVLVVLGGALVAATAYLYGTDASGSDPRARLIIGPYQSNPNGLGEALILPLALALYGLSILRQWIWRLLAWALAALIALGIFASMSRGAVVSTIAVIVILLLRLRAREPIIVGVISLLALTVTVPATFFDRFRALFTGDDATGSLRTDIWEVGLDALKDFGLFGAGLENFTMVHKLHVPVGPFGYPFGAHNSYLMVWVELGLVGFALMLGALASLYVTAARTRRVNIGAPALAGLEAAWFGVLAFAFFADTLWTKGFWLSLILLTWATRSFSAPRFSELLEDRSMVKISST